MLIGKPTGDGAPLSSGKQFRNLVKLHCLQLLKRVTAVGELTFTAGSVFSTH